MYNIIFIWFVIGFGSSLLWFQEIGKEVDCPAFQMISVMLLTAVVCSFLGLFFGVITGWHYYLKFLRKEEYVDYIDAFRKALIWNDPDAIEEYKEKWRNK